MATAILVQPQLQYFDDNGNPLALGKMYHYVAGTSTATPVYHDKELSSEWTQPIVLNAAGRVPGQIFMPATPAIKQTLTDANDVPVGITADFVPTYTPEAV